MTDDLHQDANPAESHRRFRDFLHEHVADGPLSADDTVTAIAPLLRQVANTHEAGRVAPLDGVENLYAEGIRLGFEDHRSRWPRQEPDKLLRIERAGRSAASATVSSSSP